MSTGTYDLPVTVNVHIGGATIAAFGPFDKPVAGTVNKAGNPRKYVHTSVIPANTPIWIEGAQKVRPRMAPNVGEHSDEILSGAGYSDSDIAKMRAAGTVA